MPLPTTTRHQHLLTNTPSHRAVRPFFGMVDPPLTSLALRLRRSKGSITGDNRLHEGVVNQSPYEDDVTSIGEKRQHDATEGPSTQSVHQQLEAARLSTEAADRAARNTNEAFAGFAARQAQVRDDEAKAQASHESRMRELDERIRALKDLTREIDEPHMQLQRHEEEAQAAHESRMQDLRASLLAARSAMKNFTFIRAIDEELDGRM